MIMNFTNSKVLYIIIFVINCERSRLKLTKSCVYFSHILSVNLREGFSVNILMHLYFFNFNNSFEKFLGT